MSDTSNTNAPEVFVEAIAAAKEQGLAVHTASVDVFRLPVANGPHVRVDRCNYLGFDDATYANQGPGRYRAILRIEGRNRAIYEWAIESPAGQTPQDGTKDRLARVENLLEKLIEAQTRVPSAPPPPPQPSQDPMQMVNLAKDLAAIMKPQPISEVMASIQAIQSMQAMLGGQGGGESTATAITRELPGVLKTFAELQGKKIEAEAQAAAAVANRHPPKRSQIQDHRPESRASAPAPTSTPTNPQPPANVDPVIAAIVNIAGPGIIAKASAGETEAAAESLYHLVEGLDPSFWSRVSVPEAVFQCVQAVPDLAVYREMLQGVVAEAYLIAQDVEDDGQDAGIGNSEEGSNVEST